jgi:Na+-driven multidrug efflux pump
VCQFQVKAMFDLQIKFLAPCLYRSGGRGRISSMMTPVGFQCSVCSDIHLVSEVVTLVASILPLVAMYQVFDGIAAVTSGILRARGKQVCARLFHCTL